MQETWRKVKKRVGCVTEVSKLAAEQRGPHWYNGGNMAQVRVLLSRTQVRRRGRWGSPMLAALCALPRNPDW